ncbi:MAG TPA: sensor histidine kinase [Anaerolineales bacterium]|nr:sensor histidine kinase [Anaerolineales bacterium]
MGYTHIMSLRARLTLLVVLFALAVLLNILALVYLTNAVSESLALIESVRERQLIATQMDAHLRDAEAAIYRYQIEGEIGFVYQFNTKMDYFASDVEYYRARAGDPISRGWGLSLDQASTQVRELGTQLIELRDSQNQNLESLFATQAELTDLLLATAKPANPQSTEYQRSVDGMYEASRSMLSAVTAYIASPDEEAHVQFTDAVVQFRQSEAEFGEYSTGAEQKDWAAQIHGLFATQQNLGAQLISQRDLQQSLFANFIATVFSAGQETIVGKIQPHEASQLITAQENVRRAMNTATGVSLILPLMITAFAGWLVYRLSRQMNLSVAALLKGADRVAGGDLQTPVALTGSDELARLALAFNNMMSELASREEGLRTLIGRMAQIQDEERRLIGLDLHDGLTQLIISANMHLNTLNALAASGLEGQAEKELTLSRNLVRQSIEEARKVIAELRPTMVEDFGLEEGLRRYVSEMSEAEKWTYEIVSDTGGVIIPPPVDSAIFRIAQEALTNARKHANTDRVRVELCTNEHDLKLRVEDWGRGFDPAEMDDDLIHLGLVSMQERAQMLGGICNIQSQPGKGTLVEVSIPLSALSNVKEGSRL